jgi:hypothetical protein
MMIKKIVLIACVILVCGCASKMPAGQYDKVVAENKSLDGIPYRVLTRFKVKIYEKRLEGYKQVNEGKEAEVTIADPFHLNWISFKGLPLSNGTTNLAFNEDSTLKSATLTSTTTVPATLTAAGGAATTISTAVEGFDTARQAEKTANATAATTKTSLAIAADKAYQAAKETEQARIDIEAKPDTSAADLLKARNAERSAKLDANEKARQAGLPPYFPDVVAGATS